MSPIHRFREAALLAPLFCLAFVACADDPVDPGPGPAVAEIGFAVDDSLGFYAGESAPLGAVAYDADGVAISGAAVEWTSSNPAVVSVDSAGVLTALGQGLAIVTATVDTISATLTVRVTDFVEISAEKDPLCARDVDGAVFCIGTEWLGQVSGLHPHYQVWTQVSGDLVFTSLASGSHHTCGLAGSDAYCWGSNEDGRLGGDVIDSSSEPVPVIGQPDFVSIRAGYTHNCGLDAAGNAYCWGKGTDGQLGDGSFGFSQTPVLVDVEHTWRAVDAGWRRSCGVGADGVTYCWGVVLGDEVATPIAINGVPDNLELIRTDAMSCGAVGADIYCWGDPEIPTPSYATMPDAVVDLILGNRSACALLASDDIYCWGSNQGSLLGDPALTASATPVKIDVDGRKFDAITGEWSLHCGLAQDGGVYCWGGGSIIGRPFPFTEEPTRVPAPMP